MARKSHYRRAHRPLFRHRCEYRFSQVPDVSQWRRCSTRRHASRRLFLSLTHSECGHSSDFSMHMWLDRYPLWRNPDRTTDNTERRNVVRVDAGCYEIGAGVNAATLQCGLNYIDLEEQSCPTETPPHGILDPGQFLARARKFCMLPVILPASQSAGR